SHSFSRSTSHLSCIGRGLVVWLKQDWSGCSVSRRRRMSKIYVNLLVYNYDASPRHEYVRHTCADEKKARTLAIRLHKLIDARKGNQTTRWLEQHTGSGFVERVDGIYKEVTTRL